MASRNSQPEPDRRGAALASVLMAIGCAVLVGATLVAGTTLQVGLAVSNEKRARARGAAESAASLAMCHLMEKSTFQDPIHVACADGQGVLTFDPSSPWASVNNLD